MLEYLSLKFYHKLEFDQLHCSRELFQVRWLVKLQHRIKSYAEISLSDRVLTISSERWKIHLFALHFSRLVALHIKMIKRSSYDNLHLLMSPESTSELKASIEELWGVNFISPGSPWNNIAILKSFHSLKWDILKKMRHLFLWDTFHLG